MVLEHARRFQGDVRNGGRGPDDLPAPLESKSPSEFHLHLRQLGRLVQSAYLQLRSGIFVFFPTWLLCLFLFFFFNVARDFVTGVYYKQLDSIHICCHEQAIKLLGDNEQEFSAKGVRPNVILDGCKVPFFLSFLCFPKSYLTLIVVLSLMSI